MLYREDGDGLIVVSQPAHAFVSGQLARVWGNARFGAVEPRDEVCLAADQHDLGWVEWEQHPTVYPGTKLPRRFYEMTTMFHVAIWRGASRRALTQGRYSALLVSLHLTYLYQRHNDGSDTPDEAEAARSLVAEEIALQAELVASLATDSRYSALVAPAALKRNQRLVAVWDSLSLALCCGVRPGQTIADVPAADGTVSLALTRSTSKADRIAISPWPFANETVTVTYDARRLSARTFADDAVLQASLARAPWASVEVELAPDDG